MPGPEDREPQTDLHHWVASIKALPIKRRLRILNVCGGHERTISVAGLRSVLPDTIELVPGPGCPVCVCPAHTIDQAIMLVQRPDIILCTFGDMIRVPGSAGRSGIRTLAQASANGHRVIAIHSPAEVVDIAIQHPEQQVVFLVAGFETTLAPVAAMIKQLNQQALLTNLSLLTAGKRTWPVVDWLLQGKHALDGLIAPGHVATIMGADEWRFVAEQYQLPVAVGGFSLNTLLPALFAVCEQAVHQEATLVNSYAGTVRANGNLHARAVLEEVFDTTDSIWRGIGQVPASGLSLATGWKELDAMRKFSLSSSQAPQASPMPSGCDCDRVISGNLSPVDCRLYGTACIPENPVGPCMVSDEGACHIWWVNGARKQSEHSEPA